MAKAGKVWAGKGKIAHVGGLVFVGVGAYIFQVPRHLFQPVRFFPHPQMRRAGYGLFELFMKKFWIWPIVLYVVASFTSFIQYWLDKEKAQSDSRRIAELDLHSVELLGGWPGAFIAQKAFRHKTRKESYQSTYWLIVFLHLAFWIDTLFLGQHALTFIGFNY